MKKQMDKLKKKTSSNKTIIIFLIGLFLLGIIAGSIFVTILSKSDQALVKEYIKEFIDKIQTGKLNYFLAFKNSFLCNLFYLIIIWLLGISVIGSLIVIFMYFAKGFVLGFSLSAFILQYHVKGILLAFIYFFPHHIVSMLAYTLVTIYSLKISFILVRSVIKKGSIHFKNIMHRYIVVLGVSGLMLTISSLYECFIVPLIIQNIIKLI